MPEATDRLIQYATNTRQALIDASPKDGAEWDEEKFSAIGWDMLNGAFHGLYEQALAEHCENPVGYSCLEEFRTAWVTIAAKLFTPIKGELKSSVRGAIYFEIPAAVRVLSRFHVASQIASAAKPKSPEVDDLDRSPENGPQRDLKFRWNGVDYQLTLIPYKLLIAMWGKDDAECLEIESAVWGSDVIDSLKSAIHDLNSAIDGSGWKLRKRRGQEKLFWEKPESFSSVSQKKLASN